jgi:hypothetical protein
VFPWWLLKGNGAKTVWARMVNKEDGRAEVKEDEIQIEPFGNNNVIKIKLENKQTPPDESMRRIMIKGLSTRDVIYKPWVKFSVTIFSDTTIARDFHYWLAFAAGEHQLRNSLGKEPSEIKNWLETPPLEGHLTGLGPDHDEDEVYEYRLDDDTTLTYLRKTWDADGEVVKNEKLLNHNFSVNAAPGSYWGEPADIQAQGSQKIIGSSAGDPAVRAAHLRDTLKYLVSSSMQQGAKQFVILALFRGRYFDDVRVAASVTTLDLGKAPLSEVRSYMDLYPPFANMKDRGPDYPHNFGAGDVITDRRITYELAQGSESGGSVTDKGGADVDTIELVVARIPEEWDDLDDDTLTSRVAAMPPDSIFKLRAHDNFRYTVFPFEITVRRHSIGRVGWKNIPTSDWPTGKYLFAIRTVDEFGNGGFAPVSDDYTNPWWAKVLTGK